MSASPCGLPLGSDERIRGSFIFILSRLEEADAPLLHAPSVEPVLESYWRVLSFDDDVGVWTTHWSLLREALAQERLDRQGVLPHQPLQPGLPGSFIEALYRERQMVSSLGHPSEPVSGVTMLQALTARPVVAPPALDIADRVASLETALTRLEKNTARATRPLPASSVPIEAQRRDALCSQSVSSAPNRVLEGEDLRLLGFCLGYISAHHITRSVRWNANQRYALQTAMLSTNLRFDVEGVVGKIKKLAQANLSAGPPASPEEESKQPPSQLRRLLFFSRGYRAGLGLTPSSSRRRMHRYQHLADALAVAHLRFTQRTVDRAIDGYLPEPIEPLLPSVPEESKHPVAAVVVPVLAELVPVVEDEQARKAEEEEEERKKRAAEEEQKIKVREAALARLKELDERKRKRLEEEEEEKELKKKRREQEEEQEERRRAMEEKEEEAYLKLKALYERHVRMQEEEEKERERQRELRREEAREAERLYYQCEAALLSAASGQEPPSSTDEKEGSATDKHGSVAVSVAAEPEAHVDDHYSVSDGSDDEVVEVEEKRPFEMLQAGDDSVVPGSAEVAEDNGAAPMEDRSDAPQGSADVPQPTPVVVVLSEPQPLAGGQDVPVIAAEASMDDHSAVPDVVIDNDDEVVEAEEKYPFEVLRAGDGSVVSGSAELSPLADNNGPVHMEDRSDVPQGDADVAALPVDVQDVPVVAVQASVVAPHVVVAMDDDSDTDDDDSEQDKAVSDFCSAFISTHAITCGTRWTARLKLQLEAGLLVKNIPMTERGAIGVIKCTLAEKR
jgi:hypothetical protein